jgi:hypothetical protein
MPQLHASAPRYLSRVPGALEPTYSSSRAAAPLHMEEGEGEELLEDEEGEEEEGEVVEEEEAFGSAAAAADLEPGLYVVATPIGNLEVQGRSPPCLLHSRAGGRARQSGSSPSATAAVTAQPCPLPDPGAHPCAPQDISFRAIRILKSVALILAEDTRHSRKLLSRYGGQRRPACACPAHARPCSRAGHGCLGQLQPRSPPPGQLQRCQVRPPAPPSQTYTHRPPASTHTTRRASRRWCCGGCSPTSPAPSSPTRACRPSATPAPSWWRRRSRPGSRWAPQLLLAPPRAIRVNPAPRPPRPCRGGRGRARPTRLPQQLSGQGAAAGGAYPGALRAGQRRGGLGPEHSRLPVLRLPAAQVGRQAHQAAAAGRPGGDAGVLRAAAWVGVRPPPAPAPCAWLCSSRLRGPSPPALRPGAAAGPEEDGAGGRGGTKLPPLGGAAASQRAGRLPAPPAPARPSPGGQPT